MYFSSIPPKILQKQGGIDDFLARFRPILYMEIKRKVHHRVHLCSVFRKGIPYLASPSMVASVALKE